MRPNRCLWVLACVGLLMTSCLFKAKKSKDVQAAIERMDREHQEQHSKQKEDQPGLLASKGGAPPADGIAARVNEEVIFFSDLDTAVQTMLQRMGANSTEELGPMALQEARKAALGQLIQRKLLEQEAVRRKIKVSDEEVEGAFHQYLGQRGLSKEQFYIQLARSRTSLEAFKDRMRRELMVYRMLERDIGRHVHVSEEQIQEYYQAHRDDYVKPGTVRIQQIVLITRGDFLLDKRQKREQIQQIREKILAGEDFAQMAQQFSQGPNAAKGGDCGFFKEGELLDELNRVAFSLKEGEVSPVIETSIGFHLLKVIERGTGETKPIEEVREEIRSRLGNELYDGEIRKLVEGLEKSAHIDVRM